MKTPRSWRRSRFRRPWRRFRSWWRGFPTWLLYRRLLAALKAEAREKGQPLTPERLALLKGMARTTAEAVDRAN